MSTTTNYNLNLPQKGQKDWNIQVNENFTKIDNEIKNTNDKIGDISKLDSINIVDELENHTSQLADIAINVKNFGAKGDGVTDDTQAIQAAINYCKDKCGVVFIPEGIYIITNGLIIDFSNITIKGVKGKSILKYSGLGINGNLIYIKGEDAFNSVENIIIEGLYLDGTLQQNKGGNSIETLSLTSPNPLYGGIDGIHGIYCKNIVIRDNILNDIYGDGIVFARATAIKIVNNDLYNCGGSNIGPSSPTGYDCYGDGITCFFSYNCYVGHNKIINKRVFLTHETVSSKDVYGKLCGRSGLEFEYKISADYPNDNSKWAPEFEDIQTQDQFANVFEGNYVYGYTKGIHLESDVRVKIINNHVIHNHIGVMYTGGEGCIFYGNYFDSDGVGPALQSGYDGYYCSIAVSEYGRGTQGCIITNNQFFGDSVGVMVGRDTVTISNNIFNNSGTAVWTRKAGLKFIIITGNQFLNQQDSHILYFYNSGNIVLESNYFYHTNNKSIYFEGSSNVDIVNNIFIDTFINLNIINYLNLKSNIFRFINSTKSEMVYSYNINYSNITDNKVILEKDSLRGFIFEFALYVNIERNLFKSTANDNIGVMISSEMQYVNFIENIGNAVNENFILCLQAWNITKPTIRDNKINKINCYVFKHLHGDIIGMPIITNNIGKISTNFPVDVPTNGTWNTGDIIYNTNPTPGGFIGWVCISGGTPGTWKGFGVIQE